MSLTENFSFLMLIMGDRIKFFSTNNKSLNSYAFLSGLTKILCASGSNSEIFQNLRGGGIFLDLSFVIFSGGGYTTPTPHLHHTYTLGER
jgi:hypothetical protein